MPNLIEKLMVGIGIDTSEYDQGLDKAAGKAQRAGKSIVGSLSMIGGGVVGLGLAKAAAGIGAISTAAIGGVRANLGWAETLDGIGDVLGTDANQSAALAVAIQGVGGNVDSLSGQFAFLSRGLEDAKGGLGTTGSVLDSLGISFRNADGSMRSSYDILSDVSDVVGAMPDGLEKTTLMTELFGKSGKDLSDTLGAMANGGLALAAEKAQEFGLALGDKGTDAAITFGRQVNTLKMRLGGFMVRIGGSILPMLGRLSEMLSQALDSPRVKAGIDSLVNGVANFANMVMSWVPKIIEWFGKVFAWFQANPGVIVGILAALGAAIAAFVYTTVIPAAIAMITALAPIIAIMAVIAGIAYLVYEAWTNNWGGIRDIITNFWNNTLKPIFDQLKAWLQEHIPLALAWLSNAWQTVLLPAIQAVWTFIQTYILPIFLALWTWLQTNLPLAIAWLSNIWNTVLLPALQAVWNFIQMSIIPLLQALNDIISTVVGIAVTALAGLWQNVLLPALQAVWNFIKANVMPILEMLVTKFNQHVMPALQTVGDFIATVFIEAFVGLKNAIQWVIDKVVALSNKLMAIKLPAWLTPGSPTPFETGLVGIAQALQDVIVKTDSWMGKLAEMPKRLNESMDATIAKTKTLQMEMGKALELKQSFSDEDWKAKNNHPVSSISKYGSFNVSNSKSATLIVNTNAKNSTVASDFSVLKAYNT